MHHPTSAAATNFLLLLTLTLTLSLLACDALGGKPNPDRVRGVEDDAERDRVCREVSAEIRDWEREKLLDLEDDFASGDLTFLQSMTRMEQVEREADEMTRELSRACNEGIEQRGPRQSGAHPTPTSSSRR